MQILALSIPVNGGNLLALTAPDADLSAVPETIRLLPLGHVKTLKGDFEVSEDSYKDIVAAMTAHGVDIVIDYEHQTLTGQRAPAAGWIKSLALTDDVITAQVEWTPQAREHLQNKEYRYISPVVHIQGGRVMGISSVALTNTPAIDGMYPVVNSAAAAVGEIEDDNNNEEDNKDMEMSTQLLARLGVGEDATTEEVLDAIGKLQEQAGAAKEAEAAADKVVANSVICSLLGLEAGAKTEDAAAAIIALKADGVSQSAEQMVELALSAGKLTPALRGWGLDYAQRDPAGFEAYIAKAPQLVPMGAPKAGNTLLALNTRPDMDTEAVCRQLGISAEDINTYGGAK